MDIKYFLLKIKDLQSTNHKGVMVFQLNFTNSKETVMESNLYGLKKRGIINRAKKGSPDSHPSKG